jgi:dienelactone hydrolase
MAQLEISPATALADEPVEIRVDGLTPGSPVQLRLDAHDDLGRAWRSTAQLVADENGRAAPDGMDLFWSLTALEPGPPFILRSAKPYALELSVQVDGELVARATCERRFAAEGVTRTEVREDGLVGTLFEPPGAGPHPVVLVLMGSGGGLSEQRAALLASRGWAALALAYFGMGGLPSQLSAIPLEYFDRALAFLARRPSLDSGRVFVFGQSRGGELALLLGAQSPTVKGVVAWVGSGVVFGGVGADPSLAEKAAWTRNGEPVPFIGGKQPEIPPGQPFAFTPVFEQMISDAAAVARASIAVEKIDGPVLLISGEDDALWPSKTLSDLALRRMEEGGHRFSHSHLCLARAGHLIGLPHLPTTTRVMFQPVARMLLRFGGSAADDAAASVQAWRTTLAFLREHLPPR